MRMIGTIELQLYLIVLVSGILIISLSREVACDTQSTILSICESNNQSSCSDACFAIVDDVIGATQR